MANCKDNCIHYKVCMYGDLTEYKTEQILKDDCDDFMPKDVVPKSEVVAMMQWVELLKTQLAEAKQEVARGIFEEIEKLIVKPNGMWLWQWDLDKLAELKKKYTERS